MSAAVSIPPVRVRPAHAGDVGFIIDTWRQSFREESYLFRYNRDLYFRLMSMHITGLMKGAGAMLLVACDPSDEDTIVGFVALTGPELHYVYVRDSFRKHGVARLLLSGQDVETHSFQTGAFVRRIKPVERGWTLKPRTEKSANGKFSVEMG